MIPKIIHYIWLGGSPIPPSIQECIDSWKRHMPEYQYILWDDSRIQKFDSTFIKEAIQEKKWAFASDVIRLFALYEYGGIYLDTDVMVYQSFDPLLKDKAFIGRENSMHIIGKSTINYLTTCCFGAEKGNPFISRCLHYYDNRHFITSVDKTLPTELRLDIRVNSGIMCRLAQEIGYNPSVLANTLQFCENNALTVYPSYTFDAVKLMSDTYCKHLALGTWREGPQKIYKYTLRYKIEWRIRYIVEWLLRKFNYTMIKLK